MKLHVKKNDTVVVISGKDAGKTGEVLKVYPKTGKVLVQGVNIVKKHQKPTRAKRSRWNNRKRRSYIQLKSYVILHKMQKCYKN